MLLISLGVEFIYVFNPVFHITIHVQITGRMFFVVNVTRLAVGVTRSNGLDA